MRLSLPATPRRRLHRRPVHKRAEPQEKRTAADKGLESDAAALRRPASCLRHSRFGMERQLTGKSGRWPAERWRVLPAAAQFLVSTRQKLFSSPRRGHSTVVDFRNASAKKRRGLRRATGERESNLFSS